MRRLPIVTDPDTALEIANGLEPRQVRRFAATLRARRGKAGYTKAEGLCWHRIADQIELALEANHAQ